MKPSDNTNTFICDAHIDTLSKMLKFGWDEFDNIPSDSHVTAAELRRSKVGVAVFALFTEKYERATPPLHRTLKMIDMAYEIACDHSDWLEIATNTRTIKQAHRSGKTALILSIENGLVIGDDIGQLRNFHRLGVRLMGLTWNYRNRIGDGVGCFRGRRGLTPFGKEVIREMERLGMLVDVSHLNERTFWQVVETAEQPIVATHSNAIRVCQSPRNLTDGQIKAISEAGGFIGLNFCVDFLNYSGEASISDVIKHARHIADIGGVDVLAIGSDFDGIYDTPKGLEHIGKIGKLVSAFKRAGFSRAEIDAITHRNFLRVFKNVCG